MKLGISNKIGKFTNMSKLNQHILEQPIDQRRNHREIKIYLEMNENENNMSKLNGIQQKQC